MSFPLHVKATAAGFARGWLMMQLCLVMMTITSHGMPVMGGICSTDADCGQGERCCLGSKKCFATTGCRAFITGCGFTNAHKTGQSLGACLRSTDVLNAISAVGLTRVECPSNTIPPAPGLELRDCKQFLNVTCRLYSDPAGKLDWAAQCTTPTTGQTGVSAEVRNAQARAVHVAATNPKALPAIAAAVEAAANATVLPTSSKYSTQRSLPASNSTASNASPSGRQAPQVGGLTSPNVAASSITSRGFALDAVASGNNSTTPSQAVAAPNQAKSATSGATYLGLPKLWLVMLPLFLVLALF